mgnify:CR=1 FL=1
MPASEEEKKAGESRPMPAAEEDKKADERGYFTRLRCARGVP